MRKSSAAWLLLCSLFNLGHAQDPVIQSDNSRRVIGHWSASGAAGLAKQGAAKDADKTGGYYWAAFSGIVGADLDKWLADRGVENLGLAGRPGNLKLYKVRVRGGGSAALEQLKAVTGFVNLLPVILEEKVSAGILRADGEAGAVKATVFFHRNLGKPAMEALLEGYVDEVFDDQDPRILHVLATPEKLRALAALDEVLRVQEELRKQETNDVSREITKVNALQAGILNVTAFPPTPEWNRSTAYTGDSIHVGVNEGFDLAHWDFLESLPDGSTRPRVSHGTIGINPEFHGSHVAGIIGGNGWRSELSGGTRYQWRGVAPKVQFSHYGEHGDVNNHSFTNGSDAIYNFSDFYQDDRLSNHLSYQEDWNNTAVWSAANNGGFYPQYGNQRGYYSMLVNAKNPIKVGATSALGFRASFSSMGPTRDGRWGPDICAPGESILSVSAGSNGYTWMGGTSMSGPHITGITALMMQKYRDAILRPATPGVSVHEDPMWNSSVKAILIHTAKDMVDLTGRDFDYSPDFEFAGFPSRSVVYGPGPDWATGWGMADAQRAVQHVDNNLWREAKLDAGQTHSYAITVPAGRANLRVSIAWDDPEYAGIVDESNAYANKLVNNLDLRLVSPTGQTFLPWVLDHAPLHAATVPFDGLDPITPSEILDRPAVKGVDNVNNVEVVDVANPAAGTWTIQVVGTAVTTDQSAEAGLNQDYSLVSDVNLPAPPAVPNGPDLAITRVVFSPHYPLVGKPLRFTAEVKNIGNAATVAGQAWDVEFRLFSSAFARSPLVTQALQPGQSLLLVGSVATGNFSMDGTWTPDYGGTNAITAIVDAGNSIAERRERNNTGTAIVTTATLPEPWQNRDIGYPGLYPGSANLALNQNPVAAYLYAGGADIYGTADAFHYMYRPLAGNGEITIEVVNNNAQSEWSKFGAMIREDMTEGSRNVFVAHTLSHGVSFQYRAAAGGTTTTSETPGTMPGFLRIVRAGNVFTAYKSTDNAAWTQVGTVTIAMANTVYIGFAGTSHDVNYQASSYMTLRSLTGGIVSTLRGKVLDQNLNPVSGVTVTLSGSGTGTAQTNADGLYTFGGLASGGNFTVTPAKSGYAFTPANGTVSNLQFDAVLDFAAVGNPDPGLPSPWTHASVGAEAGAVGATFDNGVFTVRGSGADVWGTADGFHYAYQTFQGDVQLTARINSVQNTDPWAKAGVMIRENTTAGSRHAFMVLTPGNGSSFQRRLTAGGASASTTTAGITAPQWVRLLKVGDNIKAYRSVDGNVWTLVDQITLSLTGQYLVGLGVTAHNTGLVCATAFSNVTVQNASVWSEADVGTVGVAGNFTQTGGTYTVRGSGADIWGNADGFHYVYQALNGDGQITARMTAIQNTDGWAKAGVMIRENTTAGSRHALMCLSSANGLGFQRREATGGASLHTGAAGAAPQWVRLVRVGNNVKGYYSTNGTTWNLVGETNIAFPASVLVGLAATSHNNPVLGSATYESVAIEPIAPNPYAALDIGAVGLAGNTQVNAGTYTLKGAGADIWGTADAFHFYHRSMSGDGEIKVRVASLTNTNPYAKAGIMIRENTSTGSRHVYTGVTPTMGLEFLRRDIVNSTTVNTSVAGTAPYWVRLTRVGNVFTSYVSTNGTAWTQVGTATIAMGADVRVGLAACSHTTGALLTGVFDQLTVVE